MKKRITTLVTLGLIITGIATYDGIDNRDMTEPENTLWSTNPMKHNNYVKGQCTNYVFDRVRDAGNKIGRSWGDAKYWKVKAQQDGYTVNHHPKVGSILQSTKGKYGHVAYIEHVFDDGTIKVKEMNFYHPFEITTRDISPQALKKYYIIHPKENKAK